MKILSYTILCFFFLFLQTANTADVKRKIVQPVEKAHSILQKTQENEEQYRIEQEKLIANLEAKQFSVEQLLQRKDVLNKELIQTKKRIATKTKKLTEIGRIEKEMDPFLHQLVLRLETLISDGLPFLLPDRSQRVAKLKKYLLDADISISERYRKVMEALQIEAEIGVTIETYQEIIKHDNQEILVNILRLGRLGLYYVNLDEGSCGFYNVAEKVWQQLPDQYIYPLHTAIAIADKRRSSELLNIPLGRMVAR